MELVSRTCKKSQRSMKQSLKSQYKNRKVLIENLQNPINKLPVKHQNKVTIQIIHKEI